MNQSINQSNLQPANQLVSESMSQFASQSINSISCSGVHQRRSQLYKTLVQHTRQTRTMCVTLLKWWCTWTALNLSHRAYVRLQACHNATCNELYPNQQVDQAGTSIELSCQAPIQTPDGRGEAMHLVASLWALHLPPLLATHHCDIHSIHCL